MKRNDADKEAKVLFPLIVAVGRNSTFSKFQQENFSQLLFELIFNRKEKKKKVNYGRAGEMLNIFIHANHKTTEPISASRHLQHPTANSRLDFYATETQGAR